ncbi:hypothetical protein L3X38_033272 [Prunus dulcis]|uniref:Uncharacterized protein n=1 Tax=Prunus dulcis TaxID=3755 RepID=A0AAD4VH18_PRUDU|nr:hypothetical protein L3X38_033272 [Prunus dulcis]
MGDEIRRYVCHIVVGPGEDLKVEAEQGYKGRAKVRGKGGIDLPLHVNHPPVPAFSSSSGSSKHQIQLALKFPLKIENMERYFKRKFSSTTSNLDNVGSSDSRDVGISRDVGSSKESELQDLMNNLPANPRL